MRVTHTGEQALRASLTLPRQYPIADRYLHAAVGCLRDGTRTLAVVSLAHGGPHHAKGEL